MLVAIAVIVRDGCVVIGRRQAPPLEGWAEFPGGKALPGEPIEAAAEREALEECGLAVRVERRISRVLTETAGARLDLHFFLCRPGSEDETAGEPRLRAPFAWAPITSLDEASFPPANAAALRALQLLKTRAPEPARPVDVGLD